jgi:phospholipid-translocating ATPase
MSPFTAIAILQFFPKCATVSPGLVILPLLAVLAITALKDGYEDIKRHQADRKVNHTIVQSLKGGEGHEGGPLSLHSNSTLTEPKPGYHNYNAMAKKDKTFVPAIPLPKGKKRKGHKGEEALATTNALSEGQVASPDQDWQTAKPNGLDLGSGPFSDSLGENSVKVVNSPASDPDCFDDLKTLGWQQTIWEDVRVGDYVKIYDNEPSPAGERCRKLVSVCYCRLRLSLFHILV